MARMTALVPAERIESRILVIRGYRVMLDSDLAKLYRVNTKRLNEQVKRNRERFPGDFMFKLTAKEKRQVVANCDHLETLKFSSTLPHAFTEHGAVMLASVLNSPRAVQASIAVVRAFIRLRQFVAGGRNLRSSCWNSKSAWESTTMKSPRSLPRFASSWRRRRSRRSRSDSTARPSWRVFDSFLHPKFLLTTQ